MQSATIHVINYSATTTTVTLDAEKARNARIAGVEVKSVARSRPVERPGYAAHLEPQ